MAYFKNNEHYPEDPYPTEESEVEYDDGFDDLNSEEEETQEVSDAERQEIRQSRLRMAVGAGNLFSVIAGTVMILVLLTLIFSIVHFVMNDMGRSFSLFQTNF